MGKKEVKETLKKTVKKTPVKKTIEENPIELKNRIKDLEVENTKLEEALKASLESVNSLSDTYQKAIQTNRNLQKQVFAMAKEIQSEPIFLIIPNTDKKFSVTFRNPSAAVRVKMGEIELSLYEDMDALDKDLSFDENQEVADFTNEQAIEYRRHRLVIAKRIAKHSRDLFKALIDTKQCTTAQQELLATEEASEFWMENMEEVERALVSFRNYNGL